MDCSSITDFQQSTAICIAKKFRNLHIGNMYVMVIFVRAHLRFSKMSCRILHNADVFTTLPRTECFRQEQCAEDRCS